MKMASNVSKPAVAKFRSIVAFRQPMNRVELRHRLPVRIVISFRRQRPLADVDDHERNIHAAFHHLRNIHLGRQTHCIVTVRREIARLNIVVRVEREDTRMNASGFGNECRIVRLSRTRADCQLKQQAGNHNFSFDNVHCLLLVPVTGRTFASNRKTEKRLLK